MKILIDSTSRNPLQKLLAIILTVGLVILGFMFSAVIFTVLLVMGLIGWIFLWWKTRDVRKQFQQMQAQMQSQMRDERTRANDAQADYSNTESKGQTIEGEAVRVDESAR